VFYCLVCKVDKSISKTVYIKNSQAEAGTHRVKRSSPGNSIDKQQAKMKQAGATKV